MIHPAIPATLLALAGPFVVALRDVPSSGLSSGFELDGTQVAQVSIHERIIIRVPRMSRMPARTYAPPREWKEHKGPKCIAVDEIAGAMLNKDGAVDLVMDDTTRLRAARWRLQAARLLFGVLSAAGRGRDDLQGP
ncbi:hypothetical protein [Sphingomonas sp. LR55]|uniref:hypothetical protein n=1 Tax=Sphingomonas sp. LR55 TaxID=3050231 RepID=UPI002FDF70B7